MKNTHVHYNVLQLVWWGIATGALFLATSTYGTLISDLEVYYRFDYQDGTDISRNERDLTLFGDVAFPDGLMGYALAPNGNNAHYAARPISDSSLNFGTEDFTIQAWVNYTDTSGEQILLEKFTGATGPGWTFTKLSNNRFAFANDSGSSPVVQSAVQTIPLGTWHHMLIRRTSGTYELFYNTNMIVSQWSANGSTCSEPLLIGRRNAADGRNFSLRGSIDEIAIWTRSLSDQEIQTLYNEGDGYIIPEPSTDILIIIGIGAMALPWRRCI